MKKEFTAKDLIKGRNYADLGNYGEFRANYLEINPEYPYYVTAHGTLCLTPRPQHGMANEIEGSIEVELKESLDLWEIENLSAGEIFKLPWDGWLSQDIPEDREF